MKSRETMAPIEELEETRRSLSAAIGEAKQSGEDVGPLIARHREIGKKIEQLREAQEDGGPGTHELVVEIIDNVGQFAALREEWDDLVDRGDVAPPFLLWEWLWPWWSVYGADRDLLIMSARRNGRLIGLAPMMRGVRRRGKLDDSVLGFMGTGERAEGDYFSSIVDRHEAGVSQALWQAVWEVASERGLGLYLQHVAIGEPEWAAAIRVAAIDGAQISVRPGRRTVCGPLPGSFEEYLEGVPSKNRRYYLRYQLERLENDLGQTQHFVASDESELPRVIESLAVLSRERLVGETHGSAWADPRFCRCIQTAGPLLLEKGVLRAETLDLRDEPIAALIGFVHNGTYFCYQMAFDSRYAEHMPGHCLLELCIRWCIDQGLDTFDFLAGEHQYKRSYFAGRKSLGDVMIFRPTPRRLWGTGVAYLAEASKGILKQILGRA